ncbi:hypothetical protein AB0C19_22625 [Micromonospora sp. NPDC048842]
MIVRPVDREQRGGDPGALLGPGRATQPTVLLRRPVSGAAQVVG